MNKTARFGQTLVVANAVSSLPAPATATANAGVEIPRLGNGRGYVEWDFEITGSAPLTLTNLSVYAFKDVWSKLVVPGLGDILVPSLTVSQIGARLRLDWVGLYKRILFAASFAGGTVTIKGNPIVYL